MGDHQESLEPPPPPSPPPPLKSPPPESLEDDDDQSLDDELLFELSVQLEVPGPVTQPRLRPNSTAKMTKPTSATRKRTGNTTGSVRPGLETFASATVEPLPLYSSPRAKFIMAFTAES